MGVFKYVVSCSFLKIKCVNRTRKRNENEEETFGNVLETAFGSALGNVMDNQFDNVIENAFGNVLENVLYNLFDNIIENAFEKCPR